MQDAAQLRDQLRALLNAPAQVEEEEDGDRIRLALNLYVAKVIRGISDATAVDDDGERGRTLLRFAAECESGGNDVSDLNCRMFQSAAEEALDAIFF